MNKMSNELNVVYSIRLNLQFNKTTIDSINYKLKERSLINKNINPFFEDIANKQKHFFHVNNPEQIIDPKKFFVEKQILKFPKTIKWSTEGDDILFEFENKILLPLEIHKYWYKHIDDSLTFNLAFKISYEHNINEFYALSAFQKSLFPNQENVESINKENLIFIGNDSLWEFIGNEFEYEANELMGLAPIENLSFKNWREFLKINEFGINQSDCLTRATFLFKDQILFKAIKNAAIQGRIKDFEDQINLSSSNIKNISQLNINKEIFIFYFISGFVNNIIDFGRQNYAEILDGLIFDHPEIEKSLTEIVDDYDYLNLILFANETSVYEFVEDSRSLEVASSQIGTCPYLFFVHMMSVHDESLIIIYEEVIQSLLNILRQNKWGKENFKNIVKDSKQMEYLSDSFDEASVEIFERVDQYKHMNILNYETERNIFQVIKLKRGFDERFNYWKNLINELETNILGIKEKVKAKNSEILEKILFFIAFVDIADAFYIASENIHKSKFIAKSTEIIERIENSLQLNSLIFTSLMVLFVFLYLIKIRNEFDNKYILLILLGVILFINFIFIK